MKEILEKLSSYNLFNYLFPGCIFVVLTAKFTAYSFVQSDIVLGAFLYYFIGLVISRFGSLLIEPFLKRVRFLKFVEYKKFVLASEKDEKLPIFSEVNNMYRTLCACFTLIILLKAYESFEIFMPLAKSLRTFFILGGLLIMFLFSYKKQTEYITKRVEARDGKA